jgi:lysophospholipase L1-like esterase
MKRFLATNLLLVAIAAAEPPTVRPILIAIAGDSTVANYPTAVPQAGWGQFLPQRFDAGVRVVNLAKNGRSTKTFLQEGLWAQVLGQKPDIVLIQFGHNDSHTPDHPEHTEAAGEYQALLSRFVDEARAGGAVPVLVTPVQRRTTVDSLMPYAQAMAKVAAQKKVTLIDLHRLSGEFYTWIGPGETAAMAKSSEDNTHFNVAGAQRIAGLVWDELVADLPQLAPHVALPSLYICGDSTAARGAAPIEGWGEAVGSFVDSTRVRVENDAVGGRSARTFIAEGRWASVRGKLRPNDFVVLQFGHNDSQSALSAARYDLPGTGEETEDIADPRTGTKVTLHTFGFYLRQMIEEGKRTGATVIVLSSVPRCKWAEAKIVRGEEGHVAWAAEVARAEGVAYVDANALIADVFDPIGQPRLKRLYYPKDNTHTNPAGARLNAACILTGLRGLNDPALTSALSPLVPGEPAAVIAAAPVAAALLPAL